jgi:hypothetical protein
MAQRKRGGLAGLYDRNKQWIAPVATGVAGLFNPLAGAAVGAAMKGFDRPGQGGIGFDVGRGAMGALQGYGAGKAAQGLKGLFGAGSAASGAAGAAGTAPATGAAGGAAGGAPTSLLGRLGQAASSKEGIAAIGGAAKGAATMLQAQQTANLERRQQEEEEERRRRQAELMLLFLPQMQFGQSALQGLRGGGMQA